MNRATGWLRDDDDSRDFPYRAFFSPLNNLPQEISYRSEMSKVEDQLTLGSCTAQALVSEAERQFRRMGIKREGSRLGLYFDERVMRGWRYEDTGAHIRDGIQVLARIGLGDENLHPYDIHRFTEKPSELYYLDAARYKIGGYYRLNNTRQIQDALARGFTASFGVPLYRSFYKTGRDGIVRDPGYFEGEEGGHAMQVIGYKTINGKLYFEIRNSWGESFGDAGHCFISEDYMQKASDIWVYEVIDDGDPAT